MRLLITGGSGYLGQTLVPLAVQQGHEVVYTTFSQDPLGWGEQVDLRDATAVSHLLHTCQPDVIIHTAGSNRTPDMHQMITQSAIHLTTFMGRIIHLSTDVVFDGRSAPYHEADLPNPLHAYGRAKAQAEQTILAHPNSVIVRTSLVYGLEQMDHGTRWIADALEAGESVTLFTNQQRNPVWVNTLAFACLELAQTNYTGVLHVAGTETLTRAEFALKMLDFWEIGKREQIQLGVGDETKWPANCVLDVSKAGTLLQTPLLSVSEVLGKM